MDAIHTIRFHAHYRFFRSLFDGSAFGKDASIWQEGSKDYPAVSLEWKSAFGSREVSIASNHPARRLAWLSNLVLEARKVAESLKAQKVLPAQFDVRLFQRTLDALRPRSR